MNSPPILQFIFQESTTCSPTGTECFENIMFADKHDCKTSCFGLYADVSFQNETAALEDVPNFGKLMLEYAEYKLKYVEHYVFSPRHPNYGKWMTIKTK